jgi:hypothetical protein
LSPIGRTNTPLIAEKKHLDEMFGVAAEVVRELT